MPSLRELQHAVRRSVLGEADAGACAWVLGAGLAPEQRLEIHRNNFLGSLVAALRLSFPAVQRLVGADFFECAAQVFAREQPPRRADLNAYGAGFADFLQRFEPAAALAYLADVARLEWAVNRALHALEAPSLDLSQLATVAPADQHGLRFAAHPSISMLRSNFPIDAIWNAVLRQDDAAMAAIDLAAGPAHLIVQRLAQEVEVLRVDEAAWRFTAALFGGESLGTVLASAQGVDAPALLAQHLSAGRCVAFHALSSGSVS